ncbi:MAG: hypothetical protein KUG77_01820, partial [Nannocystaceae bacterium]|nr:hypothetical protein [Nannocystaceae bacterium]
SSPVEAVLPGPVLEVVGASVVVLAVAVVPLEAEPEPVVDELSESGVVVGEPPVEGVSVADTSSVSAVVSSDPHPNTPTHTATPHACFKFPIRTLHGTSAGVAAR